MGVKISCVVDSVVGVGSRKKLGEISDLLGGGFCFLSKNLWVFSGGFFERKVVDFDFF